MIYFEQHTDNKSIKVGYSVNPATRKKQLEGASSDPLETIGVIPGTLKDEHQLHKLLDQNFERRHKEFWNYSDGLMSFIQSLIAGRCGLLKFFKDEKVFEPHLCCLTSMAVGFCVSIYVLGVSKKYYEYQVMRWDDGPGRGTKFWRWYIWDRPQFYDDPKEAATYFVAAWYEWVAARKPLD